MDVFVPDSADDAHLHLTSGQTVSISLNDTSHWMSSCMRQEFKFLPTMSPVTQGETLLMVDMVFGFNPI